MGGAHMSVFRGLAVRLLIAALVAVALAFPAVAAMATTQDDAVVTAQEQTPYQAPELAEVDLPGWAEPFEPLARLPLWAQAALVSAAVAGLAFVVPVASRLIWSFDEDSEPNGRGPDQ